MAAGKSSTAEVSADRVISATRVYDAPRDLVWKMWTDPAHIAQWWGPDGFTNTIHEMDVRPGGMWRFVMHGPDGTDYPNKITYLEIVKPERLVYQHGGEKEFEAVNFQVTVTFEEQGGKAKLSMRSVFPSAAARDHVVKNYGAIEGMHQHLGRLGDILTSITSGQKPFVITRVVDAPRDLVWKAWTERERLMQWFGPKGFTMSTATLDFRPGGVFHFCLRSPDGQEMWGKFAYREIVAPERIVYVHSFSDEKGGVTHHPMSPTWPLETLSTTTFTELNGKTTITIRWIPLNPTEAERATFSAGHDSMRQGWTGTLDQLAEYLAKAK